MCSPCPCLILKYSQIISSFHYAMLTFFDISACPSGTQSFGLMHTFYSYALTVNMVLSPSCIPLNFLRVNSKVFLFPLLLGYENLVLQLVALVTPIPRPSKILCGYISRFQQKTGNSLYFQA